MSTRVCRAAAIAQTTGSAALTNQAPLLEAWAHCCARRISPAAVVYCGAATRLRTLAPRWDLRLTDDAGDGNAGFVSSRCLLQLAHLQPQGGRLHGRRVFAHDSAVCQAPSMAHHCRLPVLLGDCMSLVNAAATAWYDLRRRLASGTALAGSTTVCRAAATVLAFGVGGVINQGSLAGGLGSPVLGTRPHAAGALSRLAAE